MIKLIRTFENIGITFDKILAKSTFEGQLETTTN